MLTFKSWQVTLLISSNTVKRLSGLEQYSNPFPASTVLIEFLTSKLTTGNVPGSDKSSHNMHTLYAASEHPIPMERCLEVPNMEYIMTGTSDV